MNESEQQRVLRLLTDALKAAALAARAEGEQDRAAVLIFVMRTAIALHKDLQDADVPKLVRLVEEVEKVLGIKDKGDRK